MPGSASRACRRLALLVVLIVTACSPAAEAGAWSEYRAWVQSEWVLDLAGDMADWNASANGTTDDVLRAADAIVDDLTPAMAWLDAHPPEPCYAEAHRLNRLWMTQMRNSLTGMRAAYSKRDADAVYGGLALMAQALDIRQKAGEAHQEVKC